MKKIKKCYYINLSYRKDRKVFIEKEIKKSKLIGDIAERFDAINGFSIHPRLIDKDILSENAIEDILMENINRHGLTLTQGALGVLLSYLNLFDDIKNLKNEEDVVVLIEDDSFISENFDFELKKILHELPENFDICYLGYGEEKIESELFSESLSIPRGQVTCLPGLLISKNGAEKLIRLLKNLSYQIDTEIYLKRDLLNVFVSNKKITEVKNQFDSNIQGDKNCIKKYKKQNYIFSTLAYGVNANDNALRLAADLDFFKQKIIVISDTPEIYSGFDNVIAKPYPKKDFSYNDKIFCFEEGLKYEDAVVCLDSDCRIFYEDFKKTYTNFFRIVEPGFHPSWNWGNINKENGFFSSNDAPGRVAGYGELCLKTCSEAGIDIKNAIHYQEGILALCADNGRERGFLNLWRSLAEKLDEYEKKAKSEKIGQGEGNLIGIAVSESKITVNSEDFLNFLGRDIKYNFYGTCMENYINQTPNRKTVENYKGSPLFNNKIQISFKDKNVNLKYKIYEHSSDILCMTFEWNDNRAVDFLDHEFKINNNIYHFNSDKFGNFYFKKSENLEIHHTYDWYGEKNWEKIL